MSARAMFKSAMLFACLATLVVVPGVARSGLIGAGTQPRTVALGDLNEDTYLDLISGNADGVVSVHIGRGNRTYDPRVTYACGANVTSVAVADFNGDGHLDVANGCPSIGQIGVRFGAGDGTLGARTDYAANPAALAVGDFDNDTYPDIVFANNGGASFGFLHNLGNGTFAAATYFGFNGTSDIAAGDFDNDGLLDVVAVDATGLGVTVHRGLGSLNFHPGQTYLVGASSRSVAVGLFNNDAYADLAVVTGANTVVVRLSNGDGSFGANTPYATSGNPTTVEAGDLNGDGRPDLVVCSGPGGNVASVLLNTGTGTFGAKVDYPAGNGNYAIAIGDLDVLPSIDLAITSADQNSINAMQGNGNGTFEILTDARFAWVNTTGGFNDPNSWYPPRNAPTTADILVFNRGGTFGAVGVSGTVGQIVVSGGTSVSFSASGFGTGTLNITGGTDLDLIVEKSSTLSISSFVSPVICNIAFGAVAEINGDLILGGGNNRLQSVNSSGIIFQGSGRAFLEAGSSPGTTTPFGNGTGSSALNSVRFLYGSQCIANTPTSIFGAAAPNAVTVLGPGSRFRQNVAFDPEASGRTYGDFEYNVPSGNNAFIGSSALSVDSLIVTQGTLKVAMTGPVTIRGNIVIANCSGANQLLFTPPVPATYTWGGTSKQRFYSTSTCIGNNWRVYASPNVTWNINNPAGAEFTGPWRTSSNFNFVQGVVSAAENWQVVCDSSSIVTGASQSTGWFSAPLVRRVTADGLKRIDVGDAANYLPVDVTAHGVTTPGYVLAASMTSEPTYLIGAQLDMNHRVHRSWIVEGSNTSGNFPPATFLSSLDAVLSFMPSDVDPGSDPLQFEARHTGFSNPPWLAPTTGTRTATSIEVLGLSQTVLRDYFVYAAGQPITPSLSVVNAAESEGNGAVQGAEPIASTPASSPGASLDVAIPAGASDGEFSRASFFRGSRSIQRFAQPMQAQAAGSLTFRVRLSQPAVVPISVDYQTEDGTATVADGDYTLVSGTLNFAAGDSAQDIVVPFGVDGTMEQNETFGISLSNASNATIETPTATGTILDDDDLIAPSATVVYPNGGELILQNQQVNLQWTATDNFAVNSVDLFIVRGAAAETLQIGYPNTGSYLWNASGTASNKVRFRVVAHDVNHQTIDNSNANWELSASAIGVDDDVPLAFSLPQPSPNPAPAGRNRIAFAVPREADVKLTVHDIQGRTLAKLADGPVPAGRHERTWDASRASAGVYFVRFEAPGFHAERRLVVIR